MKKVANEKFTTVKKFTNENWKGFLQMKKFTNGKFTVLANGCLAEPFQIEIRPCLEDDCYFVKFSGFEPMIMTTDEIESEFTFVK